MLSSNSFKSPVLKLPKVLIQEIYSCLDVVQILFLLHYPVSQQWKVFVKQSKFLSKIPLYTSPIFYGSDIDHQTLIFTHPKNILVLQITNQTSHRCDGQKISQYVLNSLLFIGLLVRGNYLKLLKWIKTHLSLKNGKSDTIWKEHLLDNGEIFCELAAKYNRFSVLKWLITEGCIRLKSTCAEAAKNGNLEMLQWLQKNTNSCPMDRLTCLNAIQCGRLDILEWAISNGCPIPSWITSRQIAARYGHLHILQWIHAESQTELLPFRVVEAAAEGGHIPVLSWLHSHDYPATSLACSNAVKNNHFKVLKWLRRRNCPWNVQTCQEATKNGRFDILQWAIQNGCPFDETVCATAAFHGHLEILKWLRLKGCPWNENTTVWAACGGHIDIFEWAAAHGCPWSKGYYKNVLNTLRGFKIVKWAQLPHAFIDYSLVIENITQRLRKLNLSQKLRNGFEQTLCWAQKQEQLEKQQSQERNEKKMIQNAHKRKRDI